MSDRFEDVRTFVAVVQGKGFSAAGQQLGLVKSAVSRRVKELEDRLGTRLLNRSPRSVSLTDAGMEFYERSLRLLADLQEAEEVASKGAHEAVGRLRITAPVSFAAHCLAPALKLFMDQNPRLELEIDTSDRRVDLVSEGFDLALRISQLKDSSLIARRISPIRHAVCASPAYFKRHGRPKVPQDLRKHIGVTYLYVDPRNDWAFKDGESVDVKSSLFISNGDALREAVIAGCGMAMMPTFIIFKAVQRGELEIVLTEFARPPIGLYVVYPSSRNVPNKVRRFIDFCVEQFGEAPLWDQMLGTTEKSA